MFIHKSKDGTNNICGRNVARFRTEMAISQRKLADRLQLYGLDIELAVFRQVFDKSYDELLGNDQSRR